MRTIHPTPLSKEAFAPYGRILEIPQTAPTKWGEGWTCFSDVDRLYPTSPLMVGIVRCERLPSEIRALEAHTSREEMLWAIDQPLIMVVSTPLALADPQRRPSGSDAQAFLIQPGQAVILAKGTWHSPAFSANGTPAVYYFLVEAKTDSIDQDAAPWIPFDDSSILTVI